MKKKILLVTLGALLVALLYVGSAIANDGWNILHPSGEWEGNFTTNDRVMWRSIGDRSCPDWIYRNGAKFDISDPWQWCEDGAIGVDSFAGDYNWSWAGGPDYVWNGYSACIYPTGWIDSQ